MYEKIPNRDQHGTRVPWDFASLGHESQGQLGLETDFDWRPWDCEISYLTALGPFGTIRDNRPGRKWGIFMSSSFFPEKFRNPWDFQASPMRKKSLGLESLGQKCLRLEVPSHADPWPKHLRSENHSRVRRNFL